MAISTYSEFQSQVNSEKVLLAQVEAAYRLVGWELHSGSIYKISSFDEPVITGIEDSGVALTEVSSIATVTAGKFYNDTTNQVLYLRTSDSVNPNGKFISITKVFFFSNNGVKLAYDLDVGSEIEWIPLIESSSEFGVQLDNTEQLGFAIEGSGNISFYNDRNFWDSRYDKLYWENQKVYVYSWTRALPASEAKLIYRGRIQGKTYTDTKISFSLKDVFNELRGEIQLGNIEDIGGVLVPDSLLKAKQRRIYGYVSGHRPTNIDQILDGYLLAGTVSITSGTTSLTGSGTSFLTYFSPEDEIVLPGATKKYSIQTVTSNTAMVLSDTFVDTTVSGGVYYINPKSPRRSFNRTWVVAGHATKEPATTITGSSNLAFATFGSTEDFNVGDDILVGSQTTSILKITGDIVYFTPVLSTLPPISTAITRPSVTNVRIDQDELIPTRDYSYDAATGLLTLTTTAEFNIAPGQALIGTSVTFTNTLRSVTGVATVFTSQLKIGDWIRANGQADYFEILSIESDTALTLRTAATYTATATGFYKSPNIYDEGNTVLTCDALGITENGVKTGVFVKTGAQIVKHLITDAGLDELIETTSFDNAANQADEPVGIVIPKQFGDQKTMKFRDVINEVNKSVFGALVQNEDFEFEYHVLRPKRATADLSVSESDILKFTVKSLSDKIVRTAKVRYLNKEYDYISKESSFLEVEKQSDEGSYLAQSIKEFLQETILTEEASAQIAANRWSFLFSIAQSLINLDTKMQAARTQVTDTVIFSHEKIYERIGSSSKKKVAQVQLATKTHSMVSLELDDLSNAFSRCSVICDGEGLAFDESSEDDLLYSGYITDDYGMIDNDGTTYGINLIY